MLQTPVTAAPASAGFKQAWTGICTKPFADICTKLFAGICTKPFEGICAKLFEGTPATTLATPATFLEGISVYFAIVVSFLVNSLAAVVKPLACNLLAVEARS